MGNLFGGFKTEVALGKITRAVMEAYCKEHCKEPEGKTFPSPFQWQHSAADLRRELLRMADHGLVLDEQEVREKLKQRNLGVKELEMLLLKHCTLEAQVWATSTEGHCVRIFPEEEEDVANLETAVCFSGGGARAYLATLGALRALNEMGLLDNKKIGRISSVSGSSWCMSVAMCASPDHGTDKELFGPLMTTNPETLTLETLQKDPIPFAKPATTMCLVGEALQQWIAGGKVDKEFGVWAGVINDHFLEPMGAGGDGPFCLPREKEQYEALIKRKGLDPKILRVVRPNRPFWICNSVILGPVRGPALHDRKVAFIPFEFTPLYSGVHHAPNGVITDVGKGGQVWYGGGVVSNQAFGDYVPSPWYQVAQKMGKYDSRLIVAKRFTPLAVAAGASSWAPGGAVAEHGLQLSQDLISPKTLYWSVLNPTTSLHVGHCVPQLLGDGGNIDNLGLLALLQRPQIKRILCFLQSSSIHEFPTSTVWDASVNPQIPDVKDVFVSDIWPLFGLSKDNTGTQFGHNHCFPKEELPQLIAAFQGKDKTGLPVCVRFKHRVLRNDYWGIHGDREVEVMWIVLTVVMKLAYRIPKDVNEAIIAGTNGFTKKFPVLSTINKATNAEANLLMAHMEYIMLETKDEIMDMMK